ncbi:MAG TPA: disulfide oxidoreductase [Meiothermus sp.]|jgi:disulfide bond formation protein DsbB|nr:disulfide oxidoreductase [Meiothermus sp.]
MTAEQPSAATRNNLLLAFAWLVALVATLGSLYYSEIRLFLPCELCWYQRIFMYPLAVILGIAAWRSDFNIRLYALPIAGIGWLVSLRHNLEQRFPDHFPAACKGPISCTTEYIPSFPIPLQALIAFTLIIMALLLIRSSRR